MTRNLLTAALTVGLVLGAGAVSAEPLVVVELFTSQGCSSCPPADAFFATLADQKNVIALSLHVDYWDYIGWADTFAQARFTDRQHAYARAMGEKMVYTPQIIVGGTDAMVGSEASVVRRAISAQADQQAPVDLKVTRAGDVLTISARSDTPLPAGAQVQLVGYENEATVNIGRGENAGQSVSYRNIVTSWQVLDSWSGAGDLQIKAKALKGPAVVILQTKGAGAILAAARVE